MQSGVGFSLEIFFVILLTQSIVICGIVTRVAGKWVPNRACIEFGIVDFADALLPHWDCRIVQIREILSLSNGFPSLDCLPATWLCDATLPISWSACQISSSLYLDLCCRNLLREHVDAILRPRLLPNSFEFGINSISNTNGGALFWTLHQFYFSLNFHWWNIDNPFHHFRFCATIRPLPDISKFEEEYISQPNVYNSKIYCTLPNVLDLGTASRCTYILI